MRDSVWVIIAVGGDHGDVSGSRVLYLRFLAAESCEPFSMCFIELEL